MENDEKTQAESEQHSPDVYRSNSVIGITVLFVFSWIMIGLSVIYGIRLYFNDPIHPTFIPIAGGVFAASISFAIVMTLRHVSGPVEFKIAGSEYKGATGPILMWCICFISIVFGLHMMGISDATNLEYKSVPTRPIISLMLGGLDE